MKQTDVARFKISSTILFLRTAFTEKVADFSKTHHIYDLLESDSKCQHQGLCLVQHGSVLPLVIIEEVLQQHLLIGTTVNV